MLAKTTVTWDLCQKGWVWGYIVYDGGGGYLVFMQEAWSVCMARGGGGGGGYIHWIYAGGRVLEDTWGLSKRSGVLGNSRYKLEQW